MQNGYHFDLIAEAIRYIGGHYSEQPQLDDIARHVHLSPFHFQRLFQQWAGVSPKQFLQYITVEHAKNCLRDGRSTLETSLEVGLSGNGRLHDLFVKVEACTPGEFKKRGAGLHLLFDTLETPFGRTWVAETEAGISQLTFTEDGPAFQHELAGMFPNARLERGLGRNGALVRRFFQDFQMPAGKIALDLKGTPFQIQVWKALLSIPPAQLVSYQDIANRIGQPGASRAVGSAIGKNPVAYLIPCHRVIRQTGEMGGYRWTSERKAAINGYECAQF